MDLTQTLVSSLKKDKNITLIRSESINFEINENKYRAYRSFDGAYWIIENGRAIKVSLSPDLHATKTHITTMNYTIEYPQKSMRRTPNERKQ